jgi:hypothetical protein
MRVFKMERRRCSSSENDRICHEVLRSCERTNRRLARKEILAPAEEDPLPMPQIHNFKNIMNSF